MKIYVGNLDIQTTEDMVRDLFAQFGEVGKVTMMRDRRGISKGFGFVEMPEAGAAEAAIAKLNRTMFRDRTLDITPQAAPFKGAPGKAKSRPPRFKR